ncbi:MAG: alkaline phosphatase family protein [Thermoanaerobaculaceae bacterium]
MFRRLASSVAAAFFASLGLAVAQLLLWPQVKPSVASALMASLAWGSWGALWLGLAAFLLSWVVVLLASLFRFRAREARLQHLLAWLGYFVAAVIFYNQQLTRELLPRISRQALMVLAVVTLLWATAWLVLAGRRCKPWATTSLLALWTVAVWLPWWGAREHTVQTETDFPFEFAKPSRRALVLLWEGADAPWLLPMMDRGFMPFLQGLWSRGSWGPLRTVRPFSRAASLTTWATGCSPMLHQISSRRAYRLAFLGATPVSLLLAGPWPTPHQLPWRLWQRAAPPHPREPLLWEVLTTWGVATKVVGWPLVNQLTSSFQGNGGDELGKEQSLDPTWHTLLGEAMASSSDKAGLTYRSFALAAARGLEAALVLSQTQPTVLICHLDLPSRLRPVWTGADPGGVLPLAAQFLDSQLAELWRIFGNDATYLLLASPYGLAPPDAWDRLCANLGLGNHWPVSSKASPDGFFFLLGPGVTSGRRVGAARAQDLMPTLMYLLELPVARRLSGRVLLTAVEESWASQVPIRLIPKYPVLKP